MRVSHLKKLLIAGVGVLLFSACSITKNFKRPEVKTKHLYNQPVSLDSTTLADMPWQQVFTDPHLQNLIQEALDNNLNLQVSIQQIREAEANLYQSKMQLLPSLNAHANETHSELSDNASSFPGQSSSRDQFNASLSTSWEADIWGKLGSAKRADYANLLRSEAARRAVQTTLIADVANTYYNLMALDAKLRITRQTVQNRKKVVQTMQQLKQSSVVTGAAVVQSMANRYSAEVTIPDIKQRIQEQENVLSILLGRNPGPIQRGTLADESLPDTLEVGVPAQLLRNRPDVIASEYAFRSAFETTNNARTYFYPSLTITAEGGFSSLRLEDLLKPGSIFANIVGGLTQPIFDQGRNKAYLKASKARQKEALYRYKNTILNAGREVSNALSSYRNAEDKKELRTKELDALQKSVDYSQQLLKYGNANYTEVLTAQQNLLSAELSQINDQLQQLTSVVELYRALGGGWNKKLDK